MKLSKQNKLYISLAILVVNILLSALFATIEVPYFAIAFMCISFINLFYSLIAGNDL